MTRWKLVPAYPSKEMIIDGDNKLRHCAFADDSPAGAFVRHPDGGILSVATYKAMLEAAPQPPRLSDERILEITMSDDVSLVDDQGIGARPRLIVHNSIGAVYALVRAIEREILGETK